MRETLYIFIEHFMQFKQKTNIVKPKPNNLRNMLCIIKIPTYFRQKQIPSNLKQKNLEAMLYIITYSLT
jgi:hypothetical protein